MWTKKLKNPVVVDYNPEVHGIPLWHGEPGHNQNVVKRCFVCGCLFHPYNGWEKEEVYCSFSCQAKDYLCDRVPIRCGAGNIFAKSER